MMRISRLLLATGLALTGAAAAPLVAADAGAVIAPDAATVSVDFAKSRGPRFEAERYNNVSRPTTFTAARDADLSRLSDSLVIGMDTRVAVRPAAAQQQFRRVAQGRQRRLPIGREPSFSVSART
ncbi:MAG TPA: hypothetical protein VF440_12285 [Novosphingobium sp.]